MNLLILIFLLFDWSNALIIHAPYQVGIYLFDSYNPNFVSRNFPICSAAIVHPLFCVTTADCLHMHIKSTNIVPLSPLSIYIKSGNFSEIRENVKYVQNIILHPEFNSKTLKNDIAMLQVESSFRFKPEFNERWIQLSDRYTRHVNCVYSINTPNATELYPFSQLQQTTVVNNDNCYANRTNISETNLCSFYQFDHSFMCQIDESQLKLNRDRGTPLICDNKIVGILSVIIPSNVTNSTDYCIRTLKTFAYYVNIALFEKWIHSIIAVNSPLHASDGKPIPLIPLSPPYQITNPPKQSKNIGSSINPRIMMMIIMILYVRS